MFTGQNSEVWQCLSANAYPLVWHFFENFLKCEKPLFYEVFSALDIFRIAFCPHLPIGSYGQRKSSTFCVLLL